MKIPKMRPISFTLFFVVIATVSCLRNLSIGHLLPQTAKELQNILENTTDIKSDCSGHPKVKSVEFRLYTRNNMRRPTILRKNTLKRLDPNKEIIIVIHGWLSNSTSSRILALKDVYLKRYDCNLISVDWSKYSFQPYTKAYCDVPSIARAVFQFLHSINKELGVNLNTTQLIGHTLGAQIAGVTGQLAIAQYKRKIGRIIGLDPAGQIYGNLKKTKRLDSLDALRVDVIHTDENGIGFSEDCGHEDFRPYHGMVQPGCPSIRNIHSNTSILDALCSSYRSLDYLLESIKEKIPNQECTSNSRQCFVKSNPPLLNIKETIKLPVCLVTKC